MALRPAWKGYLKLSLVTCAVELTNAVTQSEKVSFRVLNRKTGNTVKRQYIDAETGKAVSDKNEVRAYEVAADEFLLIEEEDLDAVQIESSHTLSLDTFVNKADIEEVYLDTPYYLTPADKVSQEAFAVIREALVAKKMAGLARIVLYRRERPVVIEPFDKGMLLTTLRYGETVRQASEVADIKPAELDDKMVAIASRIVDKKMGKFDTSRFEDAYEKSLLELVKAKKAGHKPAKSKPQPKQSNVVNLFDALKQSLADDEDETPSEVKAEPKSPRRSTQTKAAPSRKKPATKCKPA